MKPITVSIKKMCKLTGVKRSKAFGLARDGEVVRVKVGRKTLITYASIERLIERNAQQSEPSPDGA